MGKPQVQLSLTRDKYAELCHENWDICEKMCHFDTIETSYHVGLHNKKYIFVKCLL